MTYRLLAPHGAALQGPAHVCRAAGTPAASRLRGLEPAAKHRPDSLDKSA